MCTINYPLSYLAKVSFYLRGSRVYVKDSSEAPKRLLGTYDRDQAAVVSLPEAEKLIEQLKATPLLKHCYFNLETLA